MIEGTAKGGQFALADIRLEPRQTPMRYRLHARLHDLEWPGDPTREQNASQGQQGNDGRDRDNQVALICIKRLAQTLTVEPG